MTVFPPSRSRARVTNFKDKHILEISHITVSFSFFPMFLYNKTSLTWTELITAANLKSWGVSIDKRNTNYILVQWNALYGSESFEKTRLKHDKVRSHGISCLKHILGKSEYGHVYNSSIRSNLLNSIHLK